MEAFSRSSAAQLSCRGISKTYQSNQVRACDKIDLDLHAGEVHCILGENGAGKSTLMRILSGDQHPDEGELTISGLPVSFSSPHDALLQGIGMVHQQSNCIPELTVWENIVIGAEGTFLLGRLTRNGAVREQVDSVCDQYGFFLPYRKKASALDSNEIQTAALVSLLIRGVRVVVFDEPHSLFTGTEPIPFASVVQQLTEAGFAVAVVTHKLSAAFRMASRITILRKGKVMGTFSPDGITIEKATRLMMGAGKETTKNPDRYDLPSSIRKENRYSQSPVLSLEHVSAGKDPNSPSSLKDVSFSVYPGEIFACVGIREHGLLSLEQVLTSYNPEGRTDQFPVTGGRIQFAGFPPGVPSPKELRKAGIGYIPSNRLVSAAAVRSTVEDNAILHVHSELTRDPAGLFIDKAQSEGYTQTLIQMLAIQGSPEDLMLSLSGGNIQKLVAARELAGRPALLIACELTWGLDVMTQKQVFRTLQDLMNNQCAVLLITSETDVALAYSDRIAMFYRGSLVRTASTSRVTAAEVGDAILTGKESIYEE